jgi:polyhydroxybutyrate depolymerase
MAGFGDMFAIVLRVLLRPARAVSFRTFGLTLAVLALAGCTVPPMQGGQRGGRGVYGQRGPGERARRPATAADAGEHRTIDVGGVTRAYYFYRPSGASGSVPLVIVYHGGQGDASKIAGQTGFSEVADRNGFAVAYPESIDHWNDGRDATAGFGDDVRFTRELIDELAQRDGIDRSRVYATGASNGGLMTIRVACELANDIAAFAPVAASFPDSYMSRCKPARPVPIMIVHGSQDQLIPEEGATIPAGQRRLGGKVTPLRETVDFWRRADRCQQQPAQQTLPDRVNDGTTVQVYDYQGCAANSDVIFVNIVGGGHTWPGARVEPAGGRAGRVCRDIDGTQYIWDFFEQYSLAQR